MIDPKPIKPTQQSQIIWRQARRIVTIWVIVAMFFWAIFILVLQRLDNESARVVVAPPTSTPIPTSTLTLTPETVSVKYQLALANDSPITPSVDLWHSSGLNQRSQERGLRIPSTEQFEVEVQVLPNEFVELFAAIENNQSGSLTCRIVVAGTTIQEKTSSGKGAGVYCSGLATP
jgi:hypothetical protein